MRKKTPASRPRTPKMLTRVEVARRLGVSRVSVERFHREGRLRPARNDAAGRYLYSSTDVRTLRRELSAGGSPVIDVVIDDLFSMALDLHDRRRALIEQHVEATTWASAWAAAVASVRPELARWPPRLARRLAEAAPEDVRGADGPFVAPPRRLCPGCVVLQLLHDDCAARPWPRPATIRAAGVSRGIPIADLEAAADRLGVRRDETHWHRPVHAPTACPICPPPDVPPPPVIRPLLQALGDLIRRAPAWHALDGLLSDPAPAPPPERPATVAAAREQWRRERAAYRRVRVAVRRGHHTRVELRDRVTTAIADARARLGRASAEAVAVAGDAAAVRSWATRLVAEVRALLEAA